MIFLFFFFWFDMKCAICMTCVDKRKKRPCFSGKRNRETAKNVINLGVGGGGERGGGGGDRIMIILQWLIRRKTYNQPLFLVL